MHFPPWGVLKPFCKSAEVELVAYSIVHTHMCKEAGWRLGLI